MHWFTMHYGSFVGTWKACFFFPIRPDHGARNRKGSLDTFEEKLRPENNPLLRTQNTIVYLLARLQMNEEHLYKSNRNKGSKMLTASVLISFMPEPDAPHLFLGNSCNLFFQSGVRLPVSFMLVRSLHIQRWPGGNGPESSEQNLLSIHHSEHFNFSVFYQALSSINKPKFSL